MRQGRKDDHDRHFARSGVLLHAPRNGRFDRDSSAASSHRGKALPELNGKYIYSDWPSDRIWAYDPATKTRATIVSNQWDRQPMAMTEDNDGEIYLLHYTGVAKLVKDSARSTSRSVSSRRRSSKTWRR